MDSMDMSLSKLWKLGMNSEAWRAVVHEIKRCLLLERKVMTNLDSILKSRDFFLPAKVNLVKALIFSRSHVWM